MTKLFHQLGHQSGWNLSSLERDNAGDGVIVGPRYMEPAKVLKISEGLRSKSLFDPQFFLPNTVRGKLQDYPFFPDILSGGFRTHAWDDSFAHECAQRCISFQRELNFDGVIIPTRFYEGMPNDFIDKQESQFVAPFIEQIIDSGNVKPVYIQLILNDLMIKDIDYRIKILNWVTSYPEISGVYLVYNINNRKKQIDDINFLLGLLHFVSALKNADMSVVVGYTNTESILLLCASSDILTMGAYENLRMFSLRAFENQEGTKPWGPNPRVYVPRLLEWVEFQYLGAIARVVPNINDYLDDDEYSIKMFEPSYNWHFTKNEPYKHYFKSFYKQFKRLSESDPDSLLDNVISECNKAINEFSFLRDSGIVFPSNGGGEHLSTWITVINLWRREITR